MLFGRANCREITDQSDLVLQVSSLAGVDAGCRGQGQESGGSCVLHLIRRVQTYVSINERLSWR
jgi:hypothetical protein